MIWRSIAGHPVRGDRTVADCAEAARSTMVIRTWCPSGRTRVILKLMDRAMPRLTVTLPAELVEEVRSRADRGNVSSWIAKAMAERLARERLAEAIAEYEAESGVITDDDIAAAREHTAWQPMARRRKPPAA